VLNTAPLTFEDTQNQTLEDIIAEAAADTKTREERNVIADDESLQNMSIAKTFASLNLYYPTTHKIYKTFFKELHYCCESTNTLEFD